MRREIAEDAVPTAGTLESPAERAIGVRGVVTQEVEPRMRDLAQLSGGDQLSGGGNGGCISVVEADRRGHTLRFRGAGDGKGVGSIEPQRFFNPQVLPRIDHGGADVAVQEVGCGDAEHVPSRVDFG